MLLPGGGRCRKPASGVLCCHTHLYASVNTPCQDTKKAWGSRKEAAVAASSASRDVEPSDRKLPAAVAGKAAPFVAPAAAAVEACPAALPGFWRCRAVVMASGGAWGRCRGSLEQGSECLSRCLVREGRQTLPSNAQYLHRPPELLSRCQRLCINEEAASED